MARRKPTTAAPPASDAPDPRLGMQLGQLRIDSVLGRGGMGVVYQATDTSLGREVAVKFLTADSARSRERFIREARLAAALSHPNIVVVHHVGEHENCPYIVTELVTGGSLEELVVRRGPMSNSSALRSAIACAHALTHAHERKIIHRDIKPANLLLTSEGIVKVADFGLAKSLADGAVLTRPGMMVGSPHFIAPDLCLGFEASPATDIYSLGCTLFFLLAGKAPFDSPQLHKIIFMHMKDPFPDMKAAAPAAPAAVVEIVNRAVAKKPPDRWGSAVEMAAAMETALAGMETGSSSGLLPGFTPAGGDDARSPEERELIQALLAKYRGLSDEQKRNLPSVLSMAIKVVPGESDVLARPAKTAALPPQTAKPANPTTPARTTAPAPAPVKTAPPPTAPKTAPAPTQKPAMPQTTPPPAARPTVRAAPAGVPPGPTEGDHRRAEARIRYETGKAMVEAGNFAAAVRELDASLAILPTDAAALNYRGLARYKLKQIDAAVADFTRALEIDANFVRAYNNRGLAFNKRGDFARAIADFTEAVKRATVPEPAIYYNRGLAYYNRGDLEKAVADFDETVRIQPHYGSAYNNRGLAYYKLGKYSAAVADFDYAVGLKPDDARAFYNRGLAQAALGRDSAADSDFNRAVTIDPNLTALVNDARGR